MAKIPIILEPGRADGKLIKTNSVYDDDQEKFLSNKIKDIDDNHNNLKDKVSTLTEVVNNNELDIETKLETEKTRATNVENNLRETINNITDINEHASTAELITVNTLPNSTVSNVQQALTELFKNATFAGVAIPTTNPGIPNGPVFYLATQAGTYSNFSSLEIKQGESVILQWTDGAWTKKTTGLATEQEIIYDVSAHNDGTVFESLQDLLSSSNLSTLIPISVRHGGMSIRFIQSSDNKYIQYRYMGTETTGSPNPFHNTANWQGVDDKITVGSENLVKSVGVANAVLPLSTTINNELKDINSIKDEIDYQTSGSQQTIFFNIGGITGETFVLNAEKGFSYGAVILGMKPNGDIVEFPGYNFVLPNTFTLTDNYIQFGIKVLPNNPTQRITLKLKSNIKSKIDNTDDNVNFLQNIIYKDSPKIDETNILQTATTYTKFSYDQELKRVVTSEAYIAYEIDVSNYELFLIKFHHYCVSTDANYFGFVTEDDSVIESHLGDKGVLFFYQLIVPKGAKYFRFTYINNNPDWQPVCFVSREPLNNYISLNYKVSDIENRLNTLIPPSIDAFNNVKINRERISLFMGMYRLKAVDRTNRLVVSFNGDSIIGSQLDNITKSNEYLTGAFPPNMSKMIMARQFLDDYQFDDADVVYRNIIHSDWIKSSGAFEISNGKDEPTKTFNEIEVYGTTNVGDSAEITVTGYKFFKLVWSEYANTSKFQVLCSVNSSVYAPWHKPAILPEYIEVTNSSRCMQKYAILTLNPNNTYKFKIIATENPNNILFWGCEMWNNPRLDVVVEAFSGSRAISQVRTGQLEAYHSDWHTPALVISDILSINDYSFIVGSDNTIDQWMTSNITLYNRVIDNGIALLLFTPWQSTNYLTKNAVNVAIQNNLPYIDIQKKQIVLPPSSNIYGPDGTHLSDYGNTYFYDELKRVLNDE